jgi:putative tryptophan/tyrosine transport system substrate-binding protein
MKRREFIAGLVGAAAWPIVARAQQPTVPVIGFLSSGTPESFASYIAAFNEGLKEQGYAAGRNVAVEYRWAENHYDRLLDLAAELVRLRAAVIMSSGGLPTARAAKAATATIPIVYTGGGDPVRLGLVASLNHPGGNLTGVNWLANELGAKRLELLQRLIPQVTTVGLLVSPGNPNAEFETIDTQKAAHAFGKQIVVLKASKTSEIETSFAAFVQQGAGAVIVAGDPFFDSERDRLVALAARHALPTMYFLRGFVTAGGLMSYGASLTDAYRIAGAYAGRILKGEKPSELPVQQSTRFELVINLNTAKALGLTIPETLLATADEVIQ